MRVKLFFAIIFSTIFFSVQAQDTLKTPVITHKVDSSVVNVPATVHHADSVSALKSLPDTINVKKHSPLVAGFASAILPGAGQFYNKKYWKIPILYAGVIADIYFIISNRNSYNQYRAAYIANINGDTTNQLAVDYSADQLAQIQAYYQKYYDLSLIIGGAIYALNILDAVVDAHLFYFDVSEKLSMTIKPYVNPIHLGLLGNTGTGVTIRLNF